MKKILVSFIVFLLVLNLLQLVSISEIKGVYGCSVTATPDTVSSQAEYNFIFYFNNTHAATDQILITFPSQFLVPNFTRDKILISQPPNQFNPSSVSISGNLITITLGQPLNSGYCTLKILNTAQIQNPSAPGSYTITINIPSESVNPTCYATVQIRSAVSNVSVVLDSYNAGSVTGYSIFFTIHVSLTTSDNINIDFPSNTGFPQQFQCNLITVNGNTCSYAYRVGNQLQIRVPIAITAPASVSVVIPATVGISNPPVSGSYTIKVSTTKETTPTDSAPYTLVGSSVSNVNVTVNPPTAGSTAAYSIQFTTSPSGALTTTSDWIKIEFPVGTTLPTSPNAGYISINGRNCTSATVSGTILTIFIPSTLTIPSSSWVYITIYDNFGIVNPSAIGSNYTLKVSTSKDIIPAISNLYSITGTSITNFSVTADPLTQNSVATYTFTFKTSSTGSLSRNSSHKIYIQFPQEFVLPSSIPQSYITVNNIPCTTAVLISNNKLTITTPVDIGNNADVKVVISQSANIKNPSTPNSYLFSLYTSVDVVPISASLTIVKSTISKPVVQLTSNAINEVVGITITFNTGSGGDLQANVDKISIVFPVGFILPSSIPSSYVKINNYPVQSVVKSGYRIDITPYINIPNNSQVTIVIDKLANIKNPAVQGDYKITVYTSKETTQMESDPFKIVVLPTTTIFVNPPNPDGENGYYITTPKVSLTSTSPVDPNPTIYYYFDAGNPQIYTGVISVPEGVHTLYFYSQDKFQNKEQVQSKQFKVDTTPPTIVITSPEQNAILNTRDITIIGTTEPNATLTINGVKVDVDSQGKFSYSTTITGLTTFTIIAKDFAGNTKQLNLTVSVDTTPPKLTITQPVSFQEVHTQTITIKGQTEKDATVKINGVPVTLNPDYSFSYVLMLTTQGLNVIEVVATDLANNVTRVSIPITYIAKTKIVIQVGNTNAIVNDKVVKLDSAPQIVKGRTLVPLRFIAEAFGATIKWNPVFKLIIITLGDKEIMLQIGTNYASVNGVKYNLETAPIIYSSVTFVPIRFISDSFNASVEWDANTKTITIIYPK